MPNELVRKESIEELCNHRLRAIELYLHSRAVMAEAQRAHARATIGQMNITTLGRNDWEFFGQGNDEQFLAKITRMVDRDMWKAFIVNTPLGGLMDTQERKKFDDALLGNDMPHATAENVEATLRRLGGEAEMIFRRGLVNAFRRLSRDYVSNDGFKLGDRIIMTCVVVYEKNCNWMRASHRSEDELRDVDRVMHVLDGKPSPTYSQGITAALRDTLATWGTTGAMECESEYWRLKFFKNGNGHLFPKRPDLIKRANLLIAEHYGATIGCGAGHANLPDWSHRENLKEDFFATPEDLAALVVFSADIRPGHSVLEPSAGAGALLNAIPADARQNVTAYEINPVRCAEARECFASFKGVNIKNGDFLDSPAEPAFDRIIMNPPFSSQQDIVHVLEAYQRLTHGGRLVAIMSPSYQTRDTPLALKMRSLVEEFGFVGIMPPGSFKESGTMVNTVMVILDKPHPSAAAPAKAITARDDLFT